MLSERDAAGPAFGYPTPMALGRYVDYCVHHIETIVREIGPRPPGSDAERRAQQYLAGLLEPLAEDVHTEEFRVAPKAFMGFVPITGALLLLGVALYEAAPWAAALASVAALAIGVGELVLYRKVVDPFFPHTTSQNLLARIPPRGEVRRILLLGGHCDSAFEWRWHYLGRGFFRTILVGTAVGAALLVGATLASATVGEAVMPAPFLYAFAPFFVLVMFFSNFQRISPGANDNLTGVLLSVALAKYLGEQDVSLEHTEIRLLNTGSEECGLRGARDYAERHKGELLATPSLYVALDTFCDLDHMSVYDRDRNGTVRHDPAAAQLLVAAGRAAGIDLPLRTLPLGASDAAAFTQAGLRGIALIAMDPAPPRWYHTRLDTPDLLQPRCIEAALRVVVELVQAVDRDGLP